MQPSRYLAKFKAMEEKANQHYVLDGDYLLVERIKDEEFAKKVVTDDGRTVNLIAGVAPPRLQAGSIAEGRPMWLRVLAIGVGYYSQVTDPVSGKITEETIPLSVAPGDVILVSNISVKFFSVFGGLEGYEPDSIGLTKESEIQLRFRGEEGYQATFGVLNSTTA